MSDFTIIAIDDEVYPVPKLTPDTFQEPRPVIHWVLKSDGGYKRTIVSGGASIEGSVERGRPWEEFLRSAHVVICDLKGVQAHYDCKAETYARNLAAIGRPCPAELDKLIEAAKRSCEGISFFHKYFDILCSCRAVFFVTAYEQERPDDCVRELLDPFTCDLKLGSPTHAQERVWSSRLIPYARKFAKNDSPAAETIAAIVHSLHADHIGGYTLLHNRGAIQFAACMDEPVLIVGESGTGKEGTAKAIHDLWVRRRLQEEEDELLREMIANRSRFVSLNCSMLGETARSELFGHVRGSFTGAMYDHVGKVLHACGCALSPARRPNARGLSSAKRELSKAVASVTSAVEELSRVRTPGQCLLSSVVPALCTLGTDGTHGQTPHMALLSALQRAGSILEEAASVASGGGAADEFVARFVRSNAVLVRQQGDQVLFVPARPIGTLFLDEFGDLPPHAQQLLLRFLEPLTGEVSPLGLDGYTLSMFKVRLIVATSDPRIAKAVGTTPLLGAWRSVKESRRPMRIDLLNRVSAFVMRAEPVTSRNCRQVFDGLLASRRDWRVEWPEEARAYVVEQVCALLGDIERHVAESPDASTGPLFGHLRSLDRLIRLVDQYAASALENGIRGLVETGSNGHPVIPAAQARFIIDHFWKPALVAATGAVPNPKRSSAPNEGHGLYGQADGRELAAELVKHSTAEDKEAAARRFIEKHEVATSGVILAILIFLLSRLGREVSKEELLAYVVRQIPEATMKKILVAKRNVKQIVTAKVSGLVCCDRVWKIDVRATS